VKTEAIRTGAVKTGTVKTGTTTLCRGCSRSHRPCLHRLRPSLPSLLPLGYVPPVRTHTAITLQGMRFHARIGVLAHEATVGQPVEIDLTVWRPARPTRDLLDYRALYALAAASVEPAHTDYLEDVAERVVAGALDLPDVARARVAVRKPHVALPGPLLFAEVVIDRARESARTAPKRPVGRTRRPTPKRRRT
jgi:dihydroneopterin aldolase